MNPKKTYINQKKIKKMSYNNITDWWSNIKYKINIKMKYTSNFGVRIKKTWNGGISLKLMYNRIKFEQTLTIKKIKNQPHIHN